MAWAALSIWVLVILLVGALVMWGAARESSSSFFSSLIPGSLAWEKRRRKAKEAKLGKARIVGSFAIAPKEGRKEPPASPNSPKRVLATSSSVIEVKSLKRQEPPLPKGEPPLPKA